MKSSSKKTEDAHSQKKKNKSANEKQAEKMADDCPEPVDVEPVPESSEQEPAEQAKPDDRLLRLQADFDNYRKRVMREKEDLYRRANEDIMEELLPVLDHLELALNAVGESDQHDSIAQGFKLVGEQLLSVLGKFGLSPIATGEAVFDPNIHEAILHMPSADVPENGIVSQTRAGYMLGNQLLRAAQVVVSSGAAEDENIDQDESVA